jgi:uncharacterized protein YjbJ (UPF0337 family)
MRRKIIDKIKSNKRLYIKVCLIIFCSLILSLLMYFTSGQMEIDQEGRSRLIRNEKGQGARLEQLVLEVGDERIDFQVSISGQEYTKDELEEFFEEGIAELEQLMLGKNESLELVTRDLNLISRIPSKGIMVEWNLDNYEFMNHQGQLKEGKIPDDGVLVEIEATLNYEEDIVLYQRVIHLYPKEYTLLDVLLNSLENELEKIDKESRNNQYLVLPTTINNQPISWHLPQNYDFIGILILGVVVALLYFISEGQKKKEAIKQKKEQMLIDYPKVIETFALFIGAGMTPRTAWFKMAEMYLKQREEKGIRYVYEEMIFTMYEIKGGKVEGLCYEDFGNRIGITYYKKFGAMLAGNVKKGAKGMTQQLRSQAEDAREERKNNAKRLGDEVGTKLMLPMFLMLGVALIIVILPAFMSIQL